MKIYKKKTIEYVLACGDGRSREYIYRIGGDWGPEWLLTSDLGEAYRMTEYEARGLMNHFRNSMWSDLKALPVEIKLNLKVLERELKPF